MLARKERRLRAYPISEDDVFELLLCPQQRPSEFVDLPVIKGVPDGATIERVLHQPADKCFWFILYHESFPVVPDGEHVLASPEMTWERQAFRLAVAPDAAKPFWSVGTADENIVLQTDGEMAITGLTGMKYTGIEGSLPWTFLMKADPLSAIASSPNEFTIGGNDLLPSRIDPGDGSAPLPHAMIDTPHSWCEKCQAVTPQRIEDGRPVCSICCPEE